MAKQQPIEIFMPPNMLKAKVGSGGLDMAAVKRAEQAIDDMKEQFADWIVEDVNNLSAARNIFAANRSADTFGALYRAAHDLKGQGKTFDFPLVARVASSLCKLGDGVADPSALPLPLIDAHVDAVKIIVRDKIKDSADRMASVLATEMESQVAAFLSKNGA